MTTGSVTWNVYPLMVMSGIIDIVVFGIVCLCYWTCRDAINIGITELVRSFSTVSAIRNARVAGRGLIPALRRNWLLVSILVAAVGVAMWRTVR